MLAKRAIGRFRPKIIGITGSVGKSSAKEAIAVVLGSRYDVRKSQKSYNSEIGLAMAVLGLSTAWRSSVGWLKNIILGFQVAYGPLCWLKTGKTFSKILILEMGVDRPNDFDKLLKIVKPDIGVVTAIGQIPVHVEFFSGSEAVAKEKSKLIKSLSSDGTAILNFDDEVVWEMHERTKAKVFSFGFGSGGDMRASNYKIDLTGINFKLKKDGASVPVRLNKVYGKQHVYAAMAGASVGLAFGMNLIEISEALQKYSAPPGRLKLIEGIKNSWVLDDSYNASPLAAHAALDVLGDLQTNGRKIVVFGDMLEIGKYTIEAHKTLGQLSAKYADHIVTVGPRSKFTAEGAISSGTPKENVKSFSTSDEAAPYIKELIKKSDLILVKGSQGMRMEKVVLEIMAHPEDAEKLLVRQDEYWRDKK
ncbi:MAG: UDP-N-acetylmuramoyl-tripeptide-D-alanyl-D-alanine ligase [Parcubacteria group bacterium GW2011_GWA2_44_13]|nr:MAG: UDP-N-acetylmuramoyl-tripeptide-D-alanyl-D-alanine ligase [Parcubacteria group bacterium GW2011_GWA2_44_13]